MAKKLGAVLIFLGAFLLVLAAMSKFYMYDRLAVVPQNTETTSVSATSPGEDATYLNVAAIAEGNRDEAISEGPLQSTRVVVGDVDASKKASKELDRDIAVWNTYSCTAPPTFDCGSDGSPLSGTNDTVAFDRNTGKTVSWSGNTIETNGEITKDAPFEGQYFKFPFNAQKKTYQFWDGTLAKATPAKFVGEGEIKGMKVYKYEQTIEPTNIGTIDVPGYIVGSKEGTVTADRFYSNVRSFSVDPVTGVIVVGGESQDGYLELDGERVATTTKATLGYTDKNTTATVEEYKSKTALLGAVKTTFPLVGALVGLVLLGLGFFLRTRGTNDDDLRRGKRTKETAGV